MKKIIALSALGVVLVSCHNTSEKKDDAVVSVVNDVNNDAKTISLSYMDKSVKPQDDFFLFANGTWCKENPVPNSESRWGSFNELDQRNKTILKGLLANAAAANGPKGSDNQLLGDYYKSYTDMKKRDEVGMTVLKEKLMHVDQIRSKEDVIKVLAEQHRYGINSLFGFGVGQDLKNVDGNISYFGQSGLGLPNKDFYFKDNKAEIRKKYVDYMVKVLVLSGTDATSASTIAGKNLEFETTLASAMMAPEELRVPENTYNKYAYKDLKKELSNMDFELYLTLVGSQTFDSLVVGQPKYVAKVNELFKSTSITDWTNYLKWKTLNHYAGSLSSDFVQTNFDFYQGVLSGKKEMKPIDERAIDNITGSTLGEKLGKVFVEKTFSESAKTRINTLVDNLLATYRTRIETIDWMSPETKKEALNKLNAIGRKLVCPDEWKDLTSISITADSYVTNIDNIALYDSKDNFGKLYKPVDKKEWGMPAHMVNAYYHPLLNEIAFPAGIMQPPFFDENAEDAVNYGRIGMVIGHEFTHGFDDEGSKFGADGTFADWWQASDREAFEQRTKTLGSTFDNFCPIDGHCVNSNLTMGENIADLGGLTMAYYAYTMTEEFKSGKVINGYTPAQRFFISYAQLWKINYTEAELKNRIATDPHSPGMFRVNGPLMNCPEFFAAFNVQPGDKMRNPEDKVAKIW
jgi:putative endopeptidase